VHGPPDNRAKGNTARLTRLLLVITRTSSGKLLNVERLEHANIQLAVPLRISPQTKLLFQLRDFLKTFLG
jgi:hypothetical protein